MKRDILFLARPGNTDAQRVVRHLDSERVVWLDPSRVDRLTFEQLGGKSVTRYDGTVIDPAAVLRLWPAPEVAPHGLTFDAEAGPDYRAYLACGARAHARGLGMRFPRAVWVSDPLALEYARQKPRQLEMAAACGYRWIPRTVQTGDLAVAREFVSGELAAGRRVVIKDIAKAPPREDGQKRLSPTSEVADPDELSDEKLLDSPKILQQLIAGVDVRVTLVGDRLFATKIFVPEHLDLGVYRDYRVVGQVIAGENRKEAWFELPRDVARACRRLQWAYGLPYCAIDLMLDSSGKLWFLEINSDNVVFGDIEVATGQAISAALAELLMAAVARPRWWRGRIAAKRWCARRTMAARRLGRAA